MPDEPIPQFNEADDRFPSGKWAGFWTYSGRKERHPMDLILTFRDGEMSGEGLDFIGPFVVAGKYQLSDGKCWWDKQYVGRHAVGYSGFNEGKGIWGTWEIPYVGIEHKGGFHIWPDGMSDPTELRLGEELELPTEAEPLEIEELVPAGAKLAGQVDPD